MKAFFTHWFTLFIGSLVIFFFIMGEIVKHTKYDLAHETAVHQMKVDSAWNDLQQWSTCPNKRISDSFFRSAYSRFKALDEKEILKVLNLSKIREDNAYKADNGR